MPGATRLFQKICIFLSGSMEINVSNDVSKETLKIGPELFEC